MDPQGPARTVVAGDAFAWLAANPLPPTHAIVTSMPDASELSPLTAPAWERWFADTAELLARAVHPASVAIFYQTDVKRDGAWVDKSVLVADGARRAGLRCVQHTIVCRAPAGTATFGRPGYAHMVAWSRDLRPALAKSAADVLPSLGEMSWSRAMGTAACEAACRFLAAHTACSTVVDPFCGLGTMLAVANAHGFDAIGVERSPKRAARARELRWDADARRLAGGRQSPNSAERAASHDAGHDATSSPAPPSAGR